MKTKIYYGIIVVLSLGIYIWTNEAATFLILFVLSGIPIIAGISNYLVVKKMMVTLSLQRNECGNGHGEYRIILQNKSWFPVFHLTMTGYLKNMLTQSEYRFPLTFSLGPKGKKEKVIEINSEYCGRIDGGLENIQIHDFLGLSKRKCNYEYEGGYLVYPEEKDVATTELKMHMQDELNVQTRYLHQKGNDISEILDIRDYQKGDIQKSIHWKLSKKLGHKVVRELDMPANQEVILMMTISTEQEKNPKTRNEVVTTTLNISSSLLEQQINHDAIVIAEDGSLQGKYSIEGEVSRDWYESMVLGGDVNFMQEHLEEYIQSNDVLQKYSVVICVVDRNFETERNESRNIIYVTAE